MMENVPSHSHPAEGGTEISRYGVISEAYIAYLAKYMVR